MKTFCEYFNQSLCRSCSWIEEDYSDQIEMKKNKISELLCFPVESIQSVSSQSRAFRNKAKMSVTGSVNDPIIGLVGEYDLDQGQELLSCPIHHPKINALLKRLPHFIQRSGLHPYQIKSKKGELKGLITYYSDSSGEMYLRFVLRSESSVPAIAKNNIPLQEEFPHLKCVSANIQPIPHALLEGPKEIFISQQDHILHESGSLPLTLSPQAFVQTNARVARELYFTAARWVNDLSVNRALELYCGQGAFSFEISRLAVECLGVEINPQAVESAKANADRLMIQNAQFVCLDVKDISSQMQNFNPEVVIVNPPRRGLGEVAKLLRMQRPAHIIYSSCNIETLQLDLNHLGDCYQIAECALFDLFPHTAHFETLVRLSRVEPLSTF